MVRVALGDDQQVEAADSQSREGRQHGDAAEIEAVGKSEARVHQQRRLAALYQGRIALPYVEKDRARRLGLDRRRVSARQQQTGESRTAKAQCQPPRPYRQHGEHGARQQPARSRHGRRR